MSKKLVTAKKVIIINDNMLNQLMKLADLFYATDLNSVSKARLLAVMESLDDASDYINDYLTEENFSVNHCYADVDTSIIQ